MRLVLDTNAAISALLWSGTPGKLIEAAQQRSISLVSGDAHVLNLKSYKGIPIVDPAEAAKRLQSSR